MYGLYYPQTEDWGLSFRVGNGSKIALEGAERVWESREGVNGGKKGTEREYEGIEG